MGRDDGCVFAVWVFFNDGFFSWRVSSDKEDEKKEMVCVEKDLIIKKSK